MALSCELLKVHVDSLSEYAVTLGKQSQGLNQFRTNITALVDKSKLLGTT